MTGISNIDIDEVEKRYLAVSTFTGAGGLDIGFYKAGITPVWANDIDHNAIRTYNNFFNKDHGQVGDIRDQELPNNADIDVVIGGPPCQGFSVAGRMDPNDPRSKHVWDYLGVVKKIKPKIFVMENVKALAVNRRWKDLRDALISAAEGLGYRTRLWILNSSHYKVPQSRERMFLVGSMLGRKIPPPTPVSFFDPPTIRETLSKLPPYGKKGNETKCPAKITAAKNPVMRRSPYAGMLFNGQGRPLNLDAPSITLTASMGGNKTPIIDQNSLESGERNWVEYYHQVLLDRGEVVKQIPSHLRRLTVEESSAIQTFPEGMHFFGSNAVKYRQIGNAVPVNLAYYVGKQIYSELLSEI